MHRVQTGIFCVPPRENQYKGRNMIKINKIISLILRGTSDTNINFNDLRNLLIHYGFVERIRGSHHIFIKNGREEINQNHIK